MTTFNTLFAISPLDGRYHKKLQPLSQIVSEYGLIKYRFIVEIQWLIHLIIADQMQLPVTDKADTIAALSAIQDSWDEHFADKVKQREQITNHDVKALEYTLGDAFAENPLLKPLIPWIHFGCTSADINNTAHALMIKDVLSNCFLPELHTVSQALTELGNDCAAMPMMSRTHGQPASPTTLGKEMTNVAHRLQRLTTQLEQAPMLAKFNGAVGNYNAHQFVFPDVDWQNISKNFINSLGLSWQSHSTQVEPNDALATILLTISQVMTVVIDLARDIWFYISLNYFTQKLVANEVGSSTMPHKINPIQFENAEGNAEVARNFCTFLANKLPISRMQRDLSNSTVLRNLGSAVSYAQLSLVSLASGLSRIQPNAALMLNDLNSKYELLAEPIQMMLRAYGVVDAYDQLKNLTRGKAQLSQADYQQFVKGLDLPNDAKDRLRQLTPATYIGLAEQLAKNTKNN